MENNENRKNTKRKRKQSLMESIRLTEVKTEKIIEEKKKLEKEKLQVEQGQTMNLKSLYDYIFKSLDVDIEEIILNSHSEDEVVQKVKESLGLQI